MPITTKRGSKPCEDAHIAATKRSEVSWRLFVQLACRRGLSGVRVISCVDGESGTTFSIVTASPNTESAIQSSLKTLRRGASSSFRIRKQH